MIDVVRSEWIKLRSVRSTVVLLILAGAIVVLVALLTANDLRDDTELSCAPSASATTTTTAPTTDDPFAFDEVECGAGFEVVETPVPVNLTSLTGGVNFAVLLFGVLGVQIIGQEYRFNTIRPTFTAVPNRRKVLVGKLIVVASSTAIVSVLMLAFCWLVGTVMVDQFAVDGVDQRILWATPLFVALWTTAGLGVGAIVRQPIAGILILLGESLVLENLVGGLFRRTIPWLPFANGFQMTLRSADADGGSGPQLKGVLEGGVYFAIICLAIFAIGTVLADRRDA